MVMVGECLSVSGMKPETHSPATAQEEMGLIQQSQVLKPLAASMELWRRTHAEKSAHEQETQVFRLEKSRRETELLRQKYLETEAKKREVQAKNNKSLSGNAPPSAASVVVSQQQKLQGKSIAQHQSQVPDNSSAPIPDPLVLGENRKRKCKEPAPPQRVPWGGEPHPINGGISFLDSPGSEDSSRRRTTPMIPSSAQHNIFSSALREDVRTSTERTFQDMYHFQAANSQSDYPTFVACRSPSMVPQMRPDPSVPLPPRLQNQPEDVSSENNIQFLLQGFDDFAHDDTVAEVLADVESEPSVSSASELLKSLAQAKQSPPQPPQLGYQGGPRLAPGVRHPPPVQQPFYHPDWHSKASHMPPPYQAGGEHQHFAPRLTNIQATQMRHEGRGTQSPSSINPDNISPKVRLLPSSMPSTRAETDFLRTPASSSPLVPAPGTTTAPPVQAQPRLQHYGGFATYQSAGMTRSVMAASHMMEAVTGRARGPDNVNVALMQEEAGVRMQQQVGSVQHPFSFEHQQRHHHHHFVLPPVQQHLSAMIPGGGPGSHFGGDQAQPNHFLPSWSGYNGAPSLPAQHNLMQQRLPPEHFLVNNAGNPGAYYR